MKRRWREPKAEIVSEAIAFADARKGRMGDSAYAVLVGRIYADTENYSRGLETIEKCGRLKAPTNTPPTGFVWIVWSGKNE